MNIHVHITCRRDAQETLAMLQGLLATPAAAAVPDEVPRNKPSDLYESGLSVRAVNVLRAQNIETLEQLAAVPDSRLRLFPRMGQQTYSEVQAMMQKYGLRQ